MHISFDVEKYDGENKFSWTVSKDGEFLVFGEAASIEEALFFAMNDLYGMRELVRPTKPEHPPHSR